jgi:hypothetical protein
MTEDSGTVVLGPDWTDAEEVKLPHEVLTVEDAHRAATKYLEMGWAVTAGPGVDVAGVCACHLGAKCRNAGKHAHKGWNNEQRKTLNQSQIDKWWSDKNPLWDSRPVDQVFIVPYLSGLVVMDVDRMDEWEALDAELRPETLWVSSGSGRGGHYLYRFTWDTDEAHPPTLPGKIRGGSGEIKFRGIIAAPPSVHRNGGRYRWQNWGTEIADCPEGLLVSFASERYGTVDNSKIAPPDGKNGWLEVMYKHQLGEIRALADVTTSRPVSLFPIAASCSAWIDAGWITEEEIIGRLMKSCEANGLVRDYGESDILRQIKNGLEAGRAGE